MNGKVYVGTTRNSAGQRFGHHIRRAYGPEGSANPPNHTIARAIRLFGPDAFQLSIFRDGLSKEKAEQIEALLITLLRSCKVEYGYNSTPHGKGGSTRKFLGRHQSPEHIEKRAVQFRGKTLNVAHRDSLVKAWKLRKEKFGPSGLTAVQSEARADMLREFLRTPKGREVQRSNALKRWKENA